MFDANIWIISIIVLFSISLGLVAFFKNPRSKTNRIFLLLILFMVTWQLSNFLENEKIGQNLAKLFLRTDFASAMLVGYFWFLFVLNFSQIKRFIVKPFLKVVIFLVSLALSLLAFTNLIISNINFNTGAIRFDDGRLWPIYALVLVFLFIAGYAMLILNLFKAHGLIKMQILYIFLGASISSIIALVINLFFSNFLTIDQSRIGLYGTIVFIMCAFYAIIRYRFMDIRIAARKTFIYTVSAVFIYLIFYSVAWFYERYFGGIFATSSYLLGLILAPLFAVVFIWLYKFIQKIANKYLFFSLYSNQETIARLSDELTNSIDLSKIVDSIVDSIKQAMQLDRAGILLIDQNDNAVKYKIAKVIGFNENNGISLVQDNFLTRHLEKTQRVLVRDEMQLLSRDSNNAEERQGFDQLAENMKHIEASLCLPMIISNKLIGMIVLGSKISNDAYTKEDLDLLTTLSKQAAIAVDNARLYKEVQDFNKTLKQKVDEQTKDIQQAYDVEKQAHEELKKLDQNKTEFMLVTQHHLRTPLSVNRGFLDLLNQGQFGKIPAKMQKVISELIESTQKEINVVNELLDVSSYQLGKQMIHLEPDTDMPALMDETLKDLIVEAENKGLYLKFEKQGVIPKIPCDRTKMKLALTNVIDDCVKYTKQGGIVVTLKTQNDKLLIVIKDTGMGMTKDQIPNLFNQTFHRSEEAQKIFAVGKGLGLFLSGKIIDGHHGKIWVESEGEGKGSTFYIELPINNVNINK